LRLACFVGERVGAERLRAMWHSTVAEINELWQQRISPWFAVVLLDTENSGSVAQDQSVDSF